MLSWFNSVQLCVTLWTNPPGSSVHGILQARILEWAAMPFSRESSQPRDQTHISYVSCIGSQVLYHQCHLGSLKQQILKEYENILLVYLYRLNRKGRGCISEYIVWLELCPTSPKKSKNTVWITGGNVLACLNGCPWAERQGFFHFAEFLKFTMTEAFNFQD